MSVYGVMPMERSPPPLTHSVWWSLVTSSVLPLCWWRRGDDGSGASSLNKHVVSPDRASMAISAISFGRHGDGKGFGGRSRRGSDSWWLCSPNPCTWRCRGLALVWQRASSSSSVDTCTLVVGMELKRLTSGGSRGAVAPIMVEAQPSLTNRRILWSNGGLLLSSQLQCQRGGSSATGWCPGHGVSEIWSAQVVSSPAPARMGSLWSSFWPNCNLSSLFGVLCVRFRV